MPVRVIIHNLFHIGKSHTIINILPFLFCRQYKIFTARRKVETAALTSAPALVESLQPCSISRKAVIVPVIELAVTVTIVRIVIELVIDSAHLGLSAT